MSALAFALAFGAIAVPAAWGTSAASALARPLVRRPSPVARAEVSAWAARLPALVAVGLVAAVAMPSVRAGLGLGHCDGHGHHPHLCLWHGAALPAWLAAVGAAAWVVTAVRLGQVVPGSFRRFGVVGTA